MDQLAQISMPLVCNAGQANLEAPRHSATEAQQVRSHPDFLHNLVALYMAQRHLSSVINVSCCTATQSHNVSFCDSLQDEYLCLLADHCPRMPSAGPTRSAAAAVQSVAAAALQPGAPAAPQGAAPRLA